MPANNPDKPGRNSQRLVGRTEKGINDKLYIKRVEEKLRKSVLDILKFHPDWRTWLIQHPDSLPRATYFTCDPNLIFSKDRKLNSLFLLLKAYVENNKKIKKKDKDIIRGMMIDIVSPNGYTIKAVTLEAINRIFE